IGILPGRKQQSNLDGILTPIVKELLQYWENGVHFIGIPGTSKPHLVRCALVQLICDLPAARRIAGHLGHSATCHCSVCYSPRQNIMDLSSADDPELRRTLSDHMFHAKNYKSVLESKGRRAAEALLKANPRAVRWSPLNELPYWNPIDCTVLDSMHLILLGLCQHHWRRFWGGDYIPDPKKFEHLPQQYRKRAGKYPSLVERLNLASRNARLIPINPSRSEELLDNPEPVVIPEVVHSGSKPTSFITRDELNQIQEDIKLIIVPSWLTRPGPRFGQKSNGRVKAAEWQNIFLLYLPMTLMRLWIIEMTRGSMTDRILHLKSLLCLSIVVNITTSKTSSTSTIKLYRQAIDLYLRLISRLNEDRRLVPNHHLALHMTKFMELHGPSRHYWAFPFERFIGDLQKISHNARIG
ncbi:hypothetical protein CPB86DRAFT_671636, partial [Serendipita vermifera]